MNIIPLMAGTCALPRFRAYEHERSEDGSAQPIAAPGEKDSRFELKVVGITETVDVKSPAQVTLEGDLRVARGLSREVEEWSEGEGTGIFNVLVLPR